MTRCDQDMATSEDDTTTQGAGTFAEHASSRAEEVSVEVGGSSEPAPAVGSGTGAPCRKCQAQRKVAHRAVGNALSLRVCEVQYRVEILAPLEPPGVVKEGIMSEPGSHAGSHAG